MESTSPLERAARRALAQVRCEDWWAATLRGEHTDVSDALPPRAPAGDAAAYVASELLSDAVIDWQFDRLTDEGRLLFAAWLYERRWKFYGAAQLIEAARQAAQAEAASGRGCPKTLEESHWIARTWARLDALGVAATARGHPKTLRQIAAGATAERGGSETCIGNALLSAHVATARAARRAPLSSPLPSATERVEPVFK